LKVEKEEDEGDGGSEGDGENVASERSMSGISQCHFDDSISDECSLKVVGMPLSGSVVDRKIGGEGEGEVEGEDRKSARGWESARGRKVRMPNLRVCFEPIWMLFAPIDFHDNPEYRSPYVFHRSIDLKSGPSTPANSNLLSRLNSAATSSTHCHLHHSFPQT
jgi:hypothetical protein